MPFEIRLSTLHLLDSKRYLRGSFACGSEVLVLKLCKFDQVAAVDLLVPHIGELIGGLFDFWHCPSF